MGACATFSYLFKSVRGNVYTCKLFVRTENTGDSKWEIEQNCIETEWVSLACAPQSLEKYNRTIVRQFGALPHTLHTMWRWTFAFATRKFNQLVRDGRKQRNEQHVIMFICELNINPSNLLFRVASSFRFRIFHFRSTSRCVPLPMANCLS